MLLVSASLGCTEYILFGINALTLIYTLAPLILTKVTFIDNDIYTKYFRKELGFIEYVNIFDSLSLLLFGMGLW